MIVTRGMGQNCGFVSFGLGQFTTVVIVLPDRIFVSAMAVSSELTAIHERPLMLALLLYPIFSAVLICPEMTAKTLEAEMNAETKQPVQTGASVQPSITAVVIQPEQWGDGS